MSRFGDDYDEEPFPNAAELWHANTKRALSGKRGKKALTELREALPERSPERRVVCEYCGEIVETEPIGPGESDADRLLPMDDCPLCREEEDGL